MTGAVCIMTALASPMSVSVAPDTVVGFGTGLVTTDTTFATVVGGVAPYSYVWVRIGGSALIDATTAFSSSTSFVSDGVTSSTTRTASFRVDVTDSTGATASGGPVVAQIYGNL